MFLRSFLLALVFCTVIYAQLAINHCSEDKPCVDVKACDDFKVYLKRKYTNWPVWARNRFKSHYCGRREEAGLKIYSVCCDQPVGIETRFSTPEDIVLNGEDCGKHSSDRIAYGTNARVFEYPWMALLQDKDERFICGGSLITKWHVLTAAHCKSGQVVSVRLGENDLSKHNDCNDIYEEDCSDAVQDIVVAEFISHEKYSPSKKTNDIALIRLGRPAKLCDSVRPICLPIEKSQSPNSENLQNMIVSGWGATEQNVSASVLQYVKIPVYPNTNCRALFPRRAGFTLDESHVCTLSENGADHCSGDSGGPLQYVSQQNQFYQYGIVSFGVNSCGVHNIPGVYTKVPHFMDWIRSKLHL